MPTADQAQRDRVLHGGHSFIVQAPAGSGKTELLTQRFLRLLGNVRQPEQVLAITFTRKATREMRERIIGRLEQAANGTESTAEHERTATEYARAVLERDRKFGWCLQKNPGRLQINTIDGLCARIAGRSPLVGHGVAGLHVVEDATILFRDAARRLVEDAGHPGPMGQVHHALGRVLEHVHGNTRQLIDLLAGMLAKRDQWLKRMGVRYPDMVKVLELQQEIELAILEEALGPGRIRVLDEQLAALAADARDQEGAREFLGALEQSRNAPERTVWRIRARLAALRMVARADHFPFSPSSVASRVLPGDGPDRADRIATIKDILAEWHRDERTARSFRRFVAKPPLDDHPQARQLLEDFQLLLKTATAELAVLFMEEGQADFQHVAELAMRALGDDTDPGDALLIEDHRLAHILMDEFQDTSHTQLQLLQKLVSGWQPEDGRTLFLVGDPMQSIYRFREADVKLFNHVFDSGCLGEVPLEPVRLSSNFRSRREVIEWVNQQFDKVFDAPVGTGSGAVSYAPVAAERSRGGRVQVNAWAEALGDAEEARQVSELITEKLAAMPSVKIAVLARKRKQLEPIAQRLLKDGISFDAVQVEHLGSRPVVLDLLAFTRAILHPADRIAWLALLRAPWCALSPDQLHVVAGDSPDTDILARLSVPGLVDQLPGEKSARISLLRNAMQRVLFNRGGMPLHRLVEIAWLSCHGPYAAGSGVELENAQAYFDLLAQLEEEQPESLVEVLQERLKGLYSGSADARVQLMTIHKAKGLEFDIVILPGLHQVAGGNNRPLLRLVELKLDGADGVLMAPLKRKGAEGSSLYEYLSALDSEEEICEAQRTLYVASTRARGELHLFGAWRMTGSGKNRRPGCRAGTFMHMLWECFEDQVDQATVDNAAEGAPEEPPLLPQLKLRDEPCMPKVEPVPTDIGSEIEMRIPDRNATALGDALHLWLELIHNHWADQWTADWFKEHPDTLDSSLVRAGAEQEKLPELRARLNEMICNVLESVEGRSVVSPEGKSGSWAELALYSCENVHLRRHVLDRVHVNEESDYVIVDYKTGKGSEAQAEKWQQQLDRYGELVAIISGKPVRKKMIFSL